MLYGCRIRRTACVWPGEWPFFFCLKTNNVKKSASTTARMEIAGEESIMARKLEKMKVSAIVLMWNERFNLYTRSVPIRWCARSDASASHQLQKMLPHQCVSIVTCVRTQQLTFEMFSHKIMCIACNWSKIVWQLESRNENNRIEIDWLIYSILKYLIRFSMRADSINTIRPSIQSALKCPR